MNILFPGFSFSRVNKQLHDPQPKVVVSLCVWCCNAGFSTLGRNPAEYEWDHQTFFTKETKC